jgi:hypothetical protein
MKNKSEWPLSVSVIAIVIGLVLTLTPSASTTNKQAPKQTTVRQSQTGPAPAYRSPGMKHKVSVTDPEIMRDLEAHGASTVADYGSYKLFDLSNELLEKVAGRASTEVVDENNLLLLNAGAIDTSTSEGQGLRSEKPTAFSGKQMHLIQFAGPIKPEWYSALVATGAKVVTYIPNNAYLVYGTSTNLTAVQTLAASSYVQWDGAYTSAHRVSPRLDQVAAKESATQQRAPLADGSSPKNQLYAIQMTQDKTENAKTLALIDQLKLEPIYRQANVLNYLNVVVALRENDIREVLANRGDVVWIAPWAMPHRMDERQDFIMATGAAPAPGDYFTYLASRHQPPFFNITSAERQPTLTRITPALVSASPANSRMV